MIMGAFLGEKSRNYNTEIDIYKNMLGLEEEDNG
jgi:hypothetical protein